MSHAATLTPEVLTTLIALVRQHTGIAMTARKSVLLERRLQPRLRALSLHSYRAYRARQQRSRRGGPFHRPGDHQRHPVLPHAVHLGLLPRPLPARTGPRASGRLPVHLVGSGRQRRGAVFNRHAVRAIQAASARFPLPDHGQRHFAANLGAARAGQYSGRSVERIRLSHPDLLRKYFTPSPHGVRVNEELRQHVSFAQHNLLEALRPARQFDLVFLRNVLIYFDAEHRGNRAAPGTAQPQDEGRLITGESETIARLGTGYQFEFPMIYKAGSA